MGKLSLLAECGDLMEKQKKQDTLQRFLALDKQIYETALQELKAGQKEGHWMWYVFPQLRGLGRSQKSFNYGIVDLNEARAYLDHLELGGFLTECCEALLTHKEKTIDEIFDDIDGMKLQSSMTLFALTAGENSVFTKVLEQFFDGEQDLETVRRVMDRKCFVIVGGVLLSCIGCEDTIAIPEGVREIGANAFSQYDNLRCVTLPKSLQKINAFAFAEREKLCSINIPKNVQRIGRGAFKGCKALADKNGFLVIRHMLHDYVGNEKQIEIPDSVATIGFGAFQGNTRLQRVVIPKSVTAISENAFADCPDLILQVVAGSYGEAFAREKGIPFTIK